MSRIDIMTDIETLGTNADSTIFQIAAVAFDVTTGELLNVYNLSADIDKAEEPLRVTGGTIKWWLDTNPELMKDLLNSGDVSPEELLRDFHAFLKSYTDDKDNQVYLWGNGILFDNNMIRTQLKDLGLDYPIFFRNDRDMRTLLELAAQKTGRNEKAIRLCVDEELQNEGLVHHDALDDCRYQVALAHYCYKILMTS